MTVRAAIPSEASELDRISRDARRHWGYPDNWIRHWESDLAFTPDFIRDNHVYVAEEDGEIRGFYALSVTGDKVELEHLLVSPAVVGAGIGKELLLDAIERVAQDLVTGLQDSQNSQDES